MEDSKKDKVHSSWLHVHQKRTLILLKGKAMQPQFPRRVFHLHHRLSLGLRLIHTLWVEQTPSNLAMPQQNASCSSEPSDGEDK